MHNYNNNHHVLTLEQDKAFLKERLVEMEKAGYSHLAAVIANDIKHIERLIKLHNKETRK